MVNQLICGADECPKDYPLDKAPSITVEWVDGKKKTHKFVVPPEEYILVPDDKGPMTLEVSFADLSATQPFDCVGTEDFGLGRLFLVRNQILMKRTKDGKSFVGLMTEPENDDEVVLILIIGLGILLGGLVLVFGALAFYYFRKGSGEAGEGSFATDDAGIYQTAEEIEGQIKDE